MGIGGSEPTVYSLPSGAGFLDALAQHILTDYAGDAMADLMVLLPNRRAVSGLTQAFLRLGGGAAMLLPSIRALGDVDDPMLSFPMPHVLSLPPAIEGPQRLLRLTRLIAHWSQKAKIDVPSGQYLELARSLAGLIDSFHTEGVDPSRLRDLVAEEYATHWQTSLAFLEIVMAYWPQELADREVMDQAARRDALIRGRTADWQATPPSHPVIVAGSTGSVPAAAELIATIARLPRGMVVLPGLDLAMPDGGWDALDERHPQHALKNLLQVIGIKPAEVQPFPLDLGAAARADAVAERVRLVRRALDPPALVDRWGSLPTFPQKPQRVDLRSRRDEASYVALRLVEAAQTPGKTAALVTADRVLARFVQAELARWDLAVDDSSGVPIAQTTGGRFLRLLVEAASDGFRPVTLLSLLKHPFCALDQDRAGTRALAERLDKNYLRGVRPLGGLASLMAMEALSNQDKDRLHSLSRQLSALTDWLDRDQAGLSDLFQAHIRAAQLLCDPDTLFGGPEGRALAEHLRNWQAALAAEGGVLPGRDYAAWFEALMDDPQAVARRAFDSHPRLFIWGPMEARLNQADLMILSGLNEGVWPPDPGHDPWLSRPMRKALGLAGIDRRIGQSAHDFIEAAAAKEVVLTRAERVDGAPTVPSRWLTRLSALGVLPEADPRQTWQRALEHPEQVQSISPPAPRPPLAARPRELAVTWIERLMRDPYGVYAAKILNLKMLDPLEADPAARERGTVIHDALENFYQGLEGDWPLDAMARLVAAGEQAFQPFVDRPAIRTFWWPRFLRVAEAIIEVEQKRRVAGIRPALFEQQAKADFVPGFTVTAKADRIDRLADGTLDIIDYKTGSVPDPKRQAAGYAPQLPLEAILAERGAYDLGPRPTVSTLSYWRLSGGRNPLEIKPMKDPQDRIAQAEMMVRDLLAAFALEETPYLSQPQPLFAGFGDFDHLARLAEWRDHVEDAP